MAHKDNRNLVSSDQPIRPEQISVYVNCPACGSNFNIQCKRPVTNKNCRCNRTTFFITIQGVAHKKTDVRLYVERQDADMSRHQLDADPSGTNRNGFRIEVED